MKIVSFPSPKAFENPYLKLFYEHLDRYGIKWVGEVIFSQKWFQKNKARFEIIHLHWPEMIWRIRHVFGGILWPFSSWKVIRLKRFLEEAKSEKKVIMLTLHNLEPHENPRSLDREGMQMVCEMSDIIISHSRWAAERAIEIFKIERTKMVVMEHGTYAGEYVPSASKQEICRKIGLDETRPIFGCLGRIRGYKGLKTVVDAAMMMPDSQFLIAGKPGLMERVLNVLNMDAFASARKKIGRRLITILRELTVKEFSELMTVCDVIVIPYVKITGSGILLAALTFGKPVVVSDMPYFKEILAPEEKSFLTFRAGSSESLATALRRMFCSDLCAAGEASKRLAGLYNWGNVIKPLIGKILEKKQF